MEKCIKIKTLKYLTPVIIVFTKTNAHPIQSHVCSELPHLSHAVSVPLLPTPFNRPISPHMNVIVLGSVADPGCLSRIPDPDFFPSRIPDPKKHGEVKKIIFFFLFSYLFVAFRSC